MKPLDILEWLMTLPAEVWLVPPAIMLAMIFGITLALRRRRLNRWKEIADRTGLRLKPNSIVYAPEVVGDYRRRRLTMTIVSPQRASLGYQRKTWTRVTVAVENPEFISLRMYRQDALDTLMTSIGLATASMP